MISRTSIEFGGPSSLTDSPRAVVDTSVSVCACLIVSVCVCVFVRFVGCGACACVNLVTVSSVSAARGLLTKRGARAHQEGVVC